MLAWLLACAHGVRDAEVACIGSDRAACLAATAVAGDVYSLRGCLGGVRDACDMLRGAAYAARLRGDDARAEELESAVCEVFRYDSACVARRAPPPRRHCDAAPSLARCDVDGLQAACGWTDPAACRVLGDAIAEGAIQGDLADAADLWWRGCYPGDCRACSELLDHIDAGMPIPEAAPEHLPALRDYRRRACGT